MLSQTEQNQYIGYCGRYTSLDNVNHIAGWVIWIALATTPIRAIGSDISDEISNIDCMNWIGRSACILLMLIDRGAGDDEDVVRMKEVTYSHVIHAWMRSSNEPERAADNV